MAVKGTAYEWIDNVVVSALYPAGLKLGVYTNAADSLSQTTVLADITQPTGLGSADKTLTNTWSGTNGVVTYSGTDPIFENTDTGTWSAPIVGAFLHNGTRLIHWMDFTSAKTMTVGKQVQIDLTSLVGG